MGEAQVLGADVGARVRGAWRRPGLGVWSEWRRHVGLGAWGEWKRRAATCGTGSGASEMLCGARVGLRKSVFTRENG